MKRLKLIEIVGYIICFAGGMLATKIYKHYHAQSQTINEQLMEAQTDKLIR